MMTNVPDRHCHREETGVLSNFSGGKIRAKIIF